MDFTTLDAPLSRGELAKRSGCHLETIRFYEKIGLLLPPKRSPGGHRRYAEGDQRRLRFILRGRQLGLSIDEIRSLLSLSDSKTYTCGEIHDLTVEHISSVRTKIADLVRLEHTLVEISDKCSGGTVPECPVIDALWTETGWHE